MRDVGSALAFPLTNGVVFALLVATILMVEPLTAAQEQIAIPSHPSGVEAFRRRILWVVGLRLALLFVVLAATTGVYLRAEVTERPFTSRVVFGAIAMAFGLSAVYSVGTRSSRHLQWVADAQVALDPVVWSLLAYASGGASSPATAFYGLNCLVGAALSGPRGSILAGAASVLSYTGLCSALAFGFIRPPEDLPVDYAFGWSEVAYTFVINVLGMLVLALLSAYLSERLERTSTALASAQQRARDAERLAAFGQLAVGMAHEIRNPLGAISGAAQVLGSSEAIAGEDRELCEIIGRESVRLSEFVTNMMDLARPRPLHEQRVDLAALADEVVSLARRSESRTADVGIELKVPETPTLALCDPAQVRQVLWNLLRNGLQASAAGETVTVNVESRDGHVELRIRDRGKGIPASEVPKVFDPFYTTRSQGVGIGLALVKRIVDDHAAYGASIAIHTPKDGRGVEFCFRLRGLPSTFPGEVPPFGP